MQIRYLKQEWADKAHEKDPAHFQYARLTVTAPDEADLHEITLTCIKKLDSNGAWDFSVQHTAQTNVVTFKWNGCIIAPDALGKLHFHCPHSIQTEWGIQP